MIGIVGGGLAAAKLVEGYREAGGEEAITIWSQDRAGRITGRGSRSACCAVKPAPSPSWRIHRSGMRRTAPICGPVRRVASLDDVDADTIVVATGAPPRPLPGALALRTVDDSLTLRERAQAAGRSSSSAAASWLRGDGVVDRARLHVTQIVREPHLFWSCRRRCSRR